MAKEYQAIQNTEDMKKYKKEMPLEIAERSRERTIEKILPFLEQIRDWTMKSAYQPTVLD